MDNVFSSIPVSTLQSILNNTDTLNFVEQYLFRFAPLDFANILDDDEHLYPARSLDDFRKNAEKVAYQGKLYDVINNTIEVCAPYLKPFTPNNEGIYYFNLLQNVVANRGILTSKYINHLQSRLFDEEYTDELKIFLGLMYF